MADHRTGYDLVASYLTLTVADRRAVLDEAGPRVVEVEIEFLGGWAIPTDTGVLDGSLVGTDAVADLFGSTARQRRRVPRRRTTGPRRGSTRWPAGWAAAA